MSRYIDERGTVDIHLACGHVLRDVPIAPPYYYDKASRQVIGPDSDTEDCPAWSCQHTWSGKEQRIERIEFHPANNTGSEKNSE